VAERGLKWLIHESIVKSEPGQLYSLYDGPVYPPGSNATIWSLDTDLSHRCGVEIRVGRTVFYSCPGPISVICQQCGTCHDDAVPWADAVSAWFSGEADDTLLCPSCNHRARIFDWTFKDYEWAFGNLGFGFHNWPINETLAMELGKVLEHRVKIAYQHY